MQFKLFSLLAVVPLLVSSTVLPLAKRIDSLIVGDFATLGTSGNNAIAAIQALPAEGATWAHAHAIITTQNVLASQFIVISNDINNIVSTSGQFSQADAEALFASFNPNVGILIQNLGLLTVNRPAFDQWIPGTTLDVRNALNAFNTNFAGFKTAVFASFPGTFTDVVNAFTVTENDIQNQLNQAIAAYSV